MTVIDLKQAISERTPHATGDAICLQCEHEWVAVIPAGVKWFECPECKLERGAFLGTHYPADHVIWECNCGNQLFLLTPEGQICPACGSRTIEDER